MVPSVEITTIINLQNIRDDPSGDGIMLLGGGGGGFDGGQANCDSSEPKEGGREVCHWLDITEEEFNSLPEEFLQMLKGSVVVIFEISDSP